MIAGVLIIDKPEGPTSHDMVAVARRALGERRIGHCGTLDPMATGVLALAVGPATRLVQYLTSDEKHYEADVRFGRRTDTCDRTGTTIAQSPERPSRDALDRALDQFRGTFEQAPPVYSAKKIGGVPAHRLARRGTVVDGITPARVIVRRLEVTSFDGEVARLVMRVSAGFYVRALADDLGRALGMGAVLDSLRRTASGSFTLADAMPADVLATAPREAIAARMLPLERLLPETPARILSAEEVARVRHGQDIPGAREDAPDAVAGGPDAPLPGAAPLVRLFAPDGSLVALAVPSKRPGFLHASVVLR